ncbi:MULTISPECIES: MlaD family protein [unclassified Mycobacterium]|uniref:MlaD family protein n=1 Tax=unclassified Mycobacterium TaxID=2642494 RepID=UPI0007403D53|nr:MULTISPECIES: MlaD family protein [unclassified Mycobacterium]KUH85965.1 mammalian cell entry protein [Mycobacterium sp. GA-0227b]KUH85973.1 mammalian cell entry protein [Mycobacterium sp. GA-1999]KUH87765.1 mammalian cell entry protein [Mycobacterium sp. IS-1556]
MQSLKSLLRNPITWGAGALVFVAVVSLVLAAVYVNPPGQKIVTFYTDDAASIRPGDDVRIAGITVGSVKDLSLESNLVRVRARVDNSAFVGDQSQIDVRMLTVVGGYYVNLVPIGDAPLGETPIPRERVTMPYNLMRTLTDTTKITQNVNPQPVNESLDRIREGLTGTNVEALSAIMEAGNSVVATIERQRGQITAILEMSDEYILALTNYREQIVQLVRKLSIVIQTLELYGKNFGASLDGVGDVMMALKAIPDFYENHRAEFVEKVRQYQHKGRLFVERNGVTIRILKRLQNLFNRVLDAENAAPELLATDLCIPIPGSPC